MQNLFPVPGQPKVQLNLSHWTISTTSLESDTQHTECTTHAVLALSAFLHFLSTALQEAFKVLTLLRVQQQTSYRLKRNKADDSLRGCSAFCYSWHRTSSRKGHVSIGPSPTPPPLHPMPWLTTLRHLHPKSSRPLMFIRSTLTWKEENLQ